MSRTLFIYHRLNSPTPRYPFTVTCFPRSLPIPPHTLLFALIFHFHLPSDLYLYSQPLCSTHGAARGCCAALGAPAGHGCSGQTPPELLLSQLSTPWDGLVSLRGDTDGWEQWNSVAGTPEIRAVWFEAQLAPHQPWNSCLFLIPRSDAV